MFVLRRLDGMYALPPGQAMSYTKDLEKAWRFPSREAARRQQCLDNERIVPIEELLSRMEIPPSSVS